MALPLDEVKVVDADTHMTERHDLWTTRAPAKYRDGVPRVEQIDGAAQWVVEDGAILGRAGAGGIVDTHGNKGRSFEGLYEWEQEQAHAASYDPVARMELLEEIGIWAQIIFPGVIGLGGQNLGNIVQDPALRNVCLEIFNDANAELQAESGNRLLPMAILPAWDIEACVREAQRAKELGLRGVNLTSDPQDLGSPDLANRAWDPVWAACSALELPVHFHIGASLTTMNFFGSYPWESHDDDTRLAIGGALLFIGNARVVVNIICSGMLDRFPELKIVSVESGTGWIPFILEALDYEMDENAPQAKAALCCCHRSTSSGTSTRRRGSSTATSRISSRRSARTTSCSRPTSRTRRASTRNR
jgi:predicted TIM-barrel fold metal-dependent hydrolase